MNWYLVVLHVIGMVADEMFQGFGIAMKMGATKAEIDTICRRVRYRYHVSVGSLYDAASPELMFGCKPCS